MAVSPSLPLSSILPSLKLIWHDQLLRQQGRGTNLYFDTVDVQIALVGLHEYLVSEGDRPRVRQARFDQPRALVNTLLASGWLGPWLLLPPHGAEFVRLIDDRRAFPVESRRDKLIEQFLALLGFAVSRSTSIAQMSGEELYQFVREQAKTAERAFKAVQCVLYRPGERLKFWHERRLLQRCQYGFDYLRITRSDRFRIILEGFEAIRKAPHQFYNNFADAVSLCMLLELAAAADRDETVAVPRFFDSSGLFLKVARATNTETLLHVRVEAAERTPVLVDAQYLIFMASFRPFPTEAEAPAASTAVDPGRLYGTLTKIVAGRNDRGAMHALSAADEHDLDVLDGQDIGGIPLSKVLRDLSELVFLKNVWLEQVAKGELAGLAGRFDAEKVGSSEFRDGVEEAIESTRLSLKETAADYEKLRVVWHELRDGVQWLRQFQSQGERQPLDVIRDLELLRFSLPSAVKGRITHIMLQLLNREIENDDVSRLGQWSEIVRAYFEAVHAPDVRLEEAQVAAAALWSMRRYASIVKLLGPLVGRADAASVEVLYAAAAFRARLAEASGEAVLSRLEARLAESQQLLEKLDAEELRGVADRAIAVGYLSFHLWHSRNYAVAWREGRDGGKRPMDDDGRRLLLNAADAARIAVRIIGRLERVVKDLDRETEQKKVYAVNQKLFYLTELGPIDRVLEEEMRAAAAELATYKDPAQDLWQPTFHDTLARYHHFLACRARNSATKAEQIEEAVRQSKRARDAAPWDDLVVEYYSVVLGAKALLERSTAAEGATA